ncbi:unnamed protein product [Cochlearia groenlandica]
MRKYVRNKVQSSKPCGDLLHVTGKTKPLTFIVYEVTEVKPQDEEKLADVPVTALPTTFTDTGELITEPEEVLIKWKNVLADETSWVRAQTLDQQFPYLKLEEKLKLKGAGINTMKRVYFRVKELSDTWS